MKHSQVALLLFISVLNASPRACLAVTTTNPEDVVQLLTGTDTVDGGSNSDGNTLPQIKMPWGFNDWVPQTSGDKGSWFFHRDDTAFQGLRCTHQPSPWIGDYGHFLLQPHIGEEFQDLEWDAKMASIRPYLFNASWNGGVGLEFAPTSHAAILRLTFPKSEKFGHLSLNVGEANEGDVEVKAPHNKDVDGEPNGMIIRGYTKINSGGVPDNWRGMFFTLHSSQALVSGGETKDQPGVQTLNFRTDQGPVIVTVATSFISPKQADRNLRQEVGKKSFHDVVETGRKTWSEQLGRVKVDAIDKTQLAVFYTNLWKSMLFPRYLQETAETGQEIHRSPYTGKIRSGKMVADSGFWDSYRTVYQLQSMVFPDNLGSLIDGWVDAYKEANWLPQWASPGQHASMVGTMGDVVLADAIAKSKWGLLKGFDVNIAYESITKDAFAPPQGLYGRAGLQNYIDIGYVPSDDQSESVSRTLNYYLSDSAISRAAGLLGKHEDEKILSARSKRYTTLFNTDSHMFQPKNTKGEWDQNFNPISWGNGFTEASAMQYRFYLPFDVEGLEKLYGGSAVLCNEIENMMTYSGAVYEVGSYGWPIHEMRELEKTAKEFGQYAHGNQPVHHVLYVAKKAGCNNVADKYLRRVMKDLYTTQGWAGDEDNGEMSAWYILSALGVYGLEGAKDEIVIGSPAVKQANVQLPNNKVLKVTTENQGVDNVYVQAVTWTRAGQSSTHTISRSTNTMKFTELMQGGTLHFTMNSSPKPAAQLRAVKKL